MSYSYTTTQSDTFTVTHARHIAAKIATDLKRMQRFYGEPSDVDIQEYQKEAIALLRDDYLNRVEYGFIENGVWRIALKYEARLGGVLTADDDPGKIPLKVDTSNCFFSSFLVTNGNWDRLTEEKKEEIYKNAGITFRRKLGEEPSGRWTYDLTYSAGGRGVVRSYA